MADWTPDCMSPDELADWEHHNAASGRPAERPCYDCERAFATEMRGLGLCNGMPGSGGPTWPPRKTPRARRNRPPRPPKRVATRILSPEFSPEFLVVRTSLVFDLEPRPGAERLPVPDDEPVELADCPRCRGTFARRYLASHREFDCERWFEAFA